MRKRTFKYDDRLVEFAAEVILFCKTLPKDSIGKYYFDQILRSSGSSALNFGEAQGTNTNKDFIHKMSNVVKELKETKIAMKILEKANIGDPKMKEILCREVEEIISIGARVILNKKGI